MSRTSGFCNENRDSLKIWEKDNRHLIARFPSPNEYSKTSTEKTKEGTDTRTSYTSTMTIGWKKGEVRPYFTLSVPYEYENQYRDFGFRMTEIEIGGVKVEVTPYDAASGYVSLVKGDDGSWKAKNLASTRHKNTSQLSRAPSASHRRAEGLPFFIFTPKRANLAHD